MQKTAFLFPGQGSQHPGMGREFFNGSSASKEVFDAADRALGFPISRLCFEGPDEELRLTQNTQPAILTVSIAVLRALEEAGIRPDYVAGHSLGEYSALVCAGSLSLEQALKIVRKRGQYMQEAVPPGEGAMAAVLGLGAQTVKEICAAASESGVVSPANFNTPEQTVIAGEKAAVDRASALARERGAKKVLPLPVSAPFHCDLMAPARDRLEKELRLIDFQDLRVPLVTNVDVREVRHGNDARDSLVRQVCAPVRWVEIIRRLHDSRVTRFLEVGPGKVLRGLMRGIVPSAETSSTDTLRGVEALASPESDATM